MKGFHWWTIFGIMVFFVMWISVVGFIKNNRSICNGTEMASIGKCSDKNFE